MIIRPASAALALVLTAGFAQADYTLHILHVNDLHSRIEPITKSDSTCRAEDDAAGECFGGVARLATKVAELRAALEAEGFQKAHVISGGKRWVPSTSGSGLCQSTSDRRSGR